MVCPIPRTGRLGFVGDYTGAVLTRFQRVRNWRLEEVANPEVRIYSGTRFGEQLINGFVDYTGGFGGWGATPPLFAGDKFTFFGYTAPTSGVPCTPGCVFHVPAIVTALTITWNWTQEDKKIFWDIEFASNGIMTPNDELDDPCDDAVYCDPNLCACPTWKDCYDAAFEFCNITQAVLRFNANIQSYSNCSTECTVRREPGHLSYTLDVMDENPCKIPTIQSDYKVIIPASLTTNWTLEWIKSVGTNNFVVDMESDQVISKNNMFRMQAVNCCGGAPVRGRVIAPSTTVVWPYATPA